MKETIYALALVLGSIGATYALVSADTFDRDYKTYNTISRNTEEKPQPIRFLSDGYFITNPQTRGQRAYNDLVKDLYENKDVPDNVLYGILGKSKEAILLGDDNFYNYCLNVLDTLSSYRN